MATTRRWWLSVALVPALLALPAMAQTAPADAAEPASAQPDWSNPDHSTFEWLVAHPNPFIAPSSVDAPLASRAWLDCSGMWAWVGRQCDGLKGAWYQGRATWYFSGYSWHLPGTWDPERLKDLNANAWGGGYGFARTDVHGDNYSWYVLAFRDSHFNITTAAGWSALTYWPAQGDVAVGLGYTAFIMMRPDIAKGWPFPAALPVASVKVNKFEVMGSFIPKLNGGINHGDVAYFFVRYQF
jgi:lipid IVA palmitoyltransferase